ncbi:MAG TPA: hypothetical protein VHZ76_00320 [Gammaproteobacteria bacterium]|nr:hypothetical protein [Gammaproteobacteria bacterium]
MLPCYQRINTATSLYTTAGSIQYIPIGSFVEGSQGKHAAFYFNDELSNEAGSEAVVAAKQQVMENARKILHTVSLKNAAGFAKRVAVDPASRQDNNLRSSHENAREFGILAGHIEGSIENYADMPALVGEVITDLLSNSKKAKLGDYNDLYEILAQALNRPEDIDRRGLYLSAQDRRRAPSAELAALEIKVKRAKEYVRKLLEQRIYNYAVFDDSLKATLSEFSRLYNWRPVEQDGKLKPTAIWWDSLNPVQKNLYFSLCEAHHAYIQEIKQERPIDQRTQNYLDMSFFQYSDVLVDKLEEQIAQHFGELYFALKLEGSFGDIWRDPANLDYGVRQRAMTVALNGLSDAQAMKSTVAVSIPVVNPVAAAAVVAPKPVAVVASKSTVPRSAPIANPVAAAPKSVVPASAVVAEPAEEYVPITRSPVGMLKQPNPRVKRIPKLLLLDLRGTLILDVVRATRSMTIEKPGRKKVSVKADQIFNLQQAFEIDPDYTLPENNNSGYKYYGLFKECQVIHGGQLAINLIQEFQRQGGFVVISTGDTHVENPQTQTFLKSQGIDVDMFYNWEELWYDYVKQGLADGNISKLEVATEKNDILERKFGAKTDDERNRLSLAVRDAAEQQAIATIKMKRLDPFFHKADFYDTVRERIRSQYDIDINKDNDVTSFDDGYEKVEGEDTQLFIAAINAKYPRERLIAVNAVDTQGTWLTPLRQAVEEAKRMRQQRDGVEQQPVAAVASSQSKAVPPTVQKRPQPKKSIRSTAALLVKSFVGKERPQVRTADENIQILDQFMLFLGNLQQANKISENTEYKLTVILDFIKQLIRLERDKGKFITSHDYQEITAKWIQEKSCDKRFGVDLNDTYVGDILFGYNLEKDSERINNLVTNAKQALINVVAKMYPNKLVDEEFFDRVLEGNITVPNVVLNTTVLPAEPNPVNISTGNLTTRMPLSINTPQQQVSAPVVVAKSTAAASRPQQSSAESSLMASMFGPFARDYGKDAESNLTVVSSSTTASALRKRGRGVDSLWMEPPSSNLLPSAASQPVVPTTTAETALTEAHAALTEICKLDTGLKEAKSALTKVLKETDLQLLPDRSKEAVEQSLWYLRSEVWKTYAKNMSCFYNMRDRNNVAIPNDSVNVQRSGFMSGLQDFMVKHIGEVNFDYIYFAKEDAIPKEYLSPPVGMSNNNSGKK